MTAHNILVPGPLQSLIRRQDELLVAQDAWDDELETKKVELGTDYTIDQLAKLVVMENRRNEKLEAEKAELEAENERLKAEKAGLKSKLRRIIDAA